MTLFSNHSILFFSMKIIFALSVSIIAFMGLIATTNLSIHTQTLIALPGSGALIFALWELVKQSMLRQQQIDAEKMKNAFNISSTSHMANTTFDMHVEFCRKYIIEVNDGLIILFREGPTEKALDIASNLHKIRREYILWETLDITPLLDKFEQALRSLGASEHYLKSLDVGEKRSVLVNEIYDSFKRIMPLQNLSDEPTSEVAISYIIDSLRNHLGINQLTDLRKLFLFEALKSKSNG